MAKMAWNREYLGQLVRQTWIEWAKKQPDIADHPHWLTPWDDLAQRDKEVDRLIGEAVAQVGFDAAVALKGSRKLK